MYLYIYIYKYVYVCMYIHIYRYMYTYICIYTRTYIYIYIYKYLHICIIYICIIYIYLSLSLSLYLSPSLPLFLCPPFPFAANAQARCHALRREVGFRQTCATFPRPRTPSHSALEFSEVTSIPKLLYSIIVGMDWSVLHCVVDPSPWTMGWLRSVGSIQL